MRPASRFAPLALVLLLVLTTAAGAQSSAGYQLSWLVLCGPNGLNLEANAAAVERGQMDIVLTRNVDPLGGPDFWVATNATTGAIVWKYANPTGGVQEMALPLPEPACLAGPLGGTFTWNPINDFTDTFLTFSITAEPAVANANQLISAVGIRTPAVATAPQVAFANLAGGQVIGGSYGVKMAASGLGAAPYKWTISVDAVQKSFRIESVTSITWWWLTTGYVNGTHALAVRVVDAAGKAATGTVNVVIRN
jgi:hypothetical protein